MPYFCNPYTDIYFQVKITFADSPSVYQVFAGKIKQLKALGMTHQEIADNLKISRKTVAKGLTINT